MLDLNPDRWLAACEDRWAEEEFAEPEPQPEPKPKSLAAVCPCCKWRGDIEGQFCPDCHETLEDEEGDDE